MVTELAEPFHVSLPAISKHLRVLESAGLLEREIDGRVHRCRLAAEPMKDAAAWIAQYRAFWETQFDALEKYLEETAGEEKSTRSPMRPCHVRTTNFALLLLMVFSNGLTPMREGTFLNAVQLV